MRCAGTFRDHAPSVERAEAFVEDGELRVVPLDRAAYASGFIFRAASELVVWTGDLIRPIYGRGAGLQKLLLPMIERVHGCSGSWLLFGGEAVDAAFRPDDPDALTAMVVHAQVPIRVSPDGRRPPEPTGACWPSVC